MNNNLIDGIGSWENMINDMYTNEYEETKYKVIDYEYEESANILQLLIGKVNESNAEAISTIINKMNLTYPAYLYEN